MALTARYIMSAAYCSRMPPPGRPEFCILGRSNVGKSSFLNHFFRNNTLAKVSKAPGKTATANFYEVSDGTMWVDLPGYGFARTSERQTHRLSDLITGYCSGRPVLAGILWLFDIRHPGAGADREIAGLINPLNPRVLPILAKSDKITSSRRQQQVRVFKKLFGFFCDPVPYSVRSEELREGFEQRYEEWKKAALSDKGP
jgi:GTP-binding protein